MRIAFEQFVFDDSSRQLLRGGEEVHISPKAFQLLRILLERRPAAVSKEELIAQIWPDVVVEEANLKVLINEVRTALSDDGRKPRLIRTVHRFGYAFSAHVAPPVKTEARLLTERNAFPLRPGENLIGRDPQCAVMLDSRGVSRLHARIDVDPDRVVLHDLGSKNGTTVNGARMHEAVLLNDGDTIGMGVVIMTFRRGGDLDSTVSVDVT